MRPMSALTFLVGGAVAGHATRRVVVGALHFRGASFCSDQLQAVKARAAQAAEDAQRGLRRLLRRRGVFF